MVWVVFFFSALLSQHHSKDVGHTAVLGCASVGLFKLFLKGPVP